MVRPPEFRKDSRLGTVNRPTPRLKKGMDSIAPRQNQHPNCTMLRWKTINNSRVENFDPSRSQSFVPSLKLRPFPSLKLWPCPSPKLRPFPPLKLQSFPSLKLQPFPNRLASIHSIVRELTIEIKISAARSTAVE